MPLNESCSLDAYRENIRREIDSGKDPDQAVAIARSTLESSCSKEGKPVPQEKVEKKDRSREYLEAALEEAKKLLPGWMYTVLHRAALPRAGGRAMANRRLAAAEKAWMQKSLSGLTDRELGSVASKLTSVYESSVRQERDTRSILARVRDVCTEGERRKMAFTGPAVEEAKRESVAKGFLSGHGDAGSHAHGLDRANKKTAQDGAHCHYFVIPGTGEHVKTMEDGAHAHVIASSKVATEDDGAHSHMVMLSTGAVLETELAGSHSHSLLVETSAFDGSHVHSMRLPDGTRAKSLSIREYVDAYVPANAPSVWLPPASRIANAFNECRELEHELWEARAELENPTLPQLVTEYVRTGEVPSIPMPVMEVAEVVAGGVVAKLYDESEALVSNGKGLPLEPGDLVDVAYDGSVAGFSKELEPSTFDRAEGLRALHEQLVKATTVIPFAGPQTARVLFVAGTPSSLELARREALAGPDGDYFREKYLAPLGLSKSEVAIGFAIPAVCPTEPSIEQIDLWRDRLLKSVALYSRSRVVALGRVAKEALGPIAVLALPHPAGLRRHGDSGEVGRKLKALLKELDKSPKSGEDNAIPASIPSKGRSRKNLAESIGELREGTFRVPVVKSLSEKRVVYGVILDPYQVDLHNDWIPPAEIEATAHDFLEKSRVVGLLHNGRAEASVVESWVEVYPSPKDRDLALQNLPHRAYRREFGSDRVHSGAWIAGVKLSEELWESYKRGELDAFSIGGFSFKNQVTTDAMPAVEFLDLQPSL